MTSLIVYIIIYKVIHKPTSEKTNNMNTRTSQKTLKKMELTFSAIAAKAGSPIRLLDAKALSIDLQQLYLASIPEISHQIVTREYNRKKLKGKESMIPEISW